MTVNTQSWPISTSPRVFVSAGDVATMTVKNAGPSIVYYGSETVTSGTAVGSIASGSSATVGAGQWFVSADTSRLFVTPVVASGGGTTVTRDGVEVNPLEITTDLTPSAASIRTQIGVSPSPTGTPDGTKFLRDDNTWQAAGGASSLAIPEVAAAHGQKSVSTDPGGSSSNLSLVAGKLYLARLLDTPAATFSAITIGIGTVGVDGAAVGVNGFVGLYYKSGTNLVLAGSSIDQFGATNGTTIPISWKSGATGARANIPITEASAGSLTGRGGASEPLFVGILIGTQPTTAVQIGITAANGSITNMGLVTGTDLLRTAVIGTGGTSLTASFPTNAIASLATDRLLVVAAK